MALSLSLMSMPSAVAAQALARTATVTAVDIPDAACSKGFHKAKLSASSMKPGEPAYIEFRSRMSAAIPSGHMYVVFGRLDANGVPVTHHIVGLYPKGLLLGMYGGAVAWVPAHVKPFGQECTIGAVIDAWRISLSESQYQSVLARARAKLAKPPLWNMFGFNCNHFAAEFGDLIGLTRPSNSALPAFAYLPAYMKANPSRSAKAK
ncbi:MAG: hypothetical protein WCC66_15155 [Rhizobiaceae bacterium]